MNASNCYLWLNNEYIPTSQKVTNAASEWKLERTKITILPQQNDRNIVNGTYIFPCCIETEPWTPKPTKPWVWWTVTPLILWMVPSLIVSTRINIWASGLTKWIIQIGFFYRARFLSFVKQQKNKSSCQTFMPVIDYGDIIYMNAVATVLKPLHTVDRSALLRAIGSVRITAVCIRK